MDDNSKSKELSDEEIMALELEALNSDSNKLYTIKSNARRRIIDIVLHRNKPLVVDIEELPYGVTLQVANVLRGVNLLGEKPTIREIAAFVYANRDATLKVIGYAAQKQKGEPSIELLEFIEWNTTTVEQAIIFYKIIKSSNIVPFYNTIAQLKTKMGS